MIIHGPGFSTEIHDNHYRIYQFILVFMHLQKIVGGGNQLLININISSVRDFLVKISVCGIFSCWRGGGGGGAGTLHIKKYQKSLLIRGEVKLIGTVLSWYKIDN